MIAARPRFPALILTSADTSGIIHIDGYRFEEDVVRKLREVFRSRSVNADFCDQCAAVMTSGRCLEQHIENAKVRALMQTGRVF